MKQLQAKSFVNLTSFLLLFVAIVRRDLQAWCLGGVLAVWVIYYLVMFIACISGKPNGVKETEIAEPPRRAYKSVSTELIHLNARVTEHLRIAFPNITWEWEDAMDDYLMYERGTYRISVSGAGDYNAADVTLTQYGDIDCKMLRVASLDYEPPTDENENATKAWFDLIGKDVLEPIIVDAKTRGFRGIYVKPNGEIHTHQNGQSAFCGRLSLPDRFSWRKFIDMITSVGLNAGPTDDGMLVTWS